LIYYRSIRKERELISMFRKLSKMAVLSFLLSLLICSSMVGIVAAGKINTRNLEAEQFILEKSASINETLSKLFYKTEILAAMVRLGGGDIQDFDSVAAMIADDPAILNVLIAPGGVVSKMYSVLGDAEFIRELG